jgi:hypothetical protein
MQVLAQSYIELGERLADARTIFKSREHIELDDKVMKLTAAKGRNTSRPFDRSRGLNGFTPFKLSLSS